jgi:4-amino-4-deoxy-L-arabinose transferase-like glycosyltransferase
MDLTGPLRATISCPDSHTMYTQKLFKATPLANILIVIFCLVMLLTAILQAGDYGITFDEPAQDHYGQEVLHWYTSLGQNTSFLQDYTDSQGTPRAAYGPFFQVLVALAQHFFGHHWETRHIITALVGVLGVIALMLCGYELGGPWLALLAGLLLWLYPRYYGTIFNNPKDVPFATGMTLILWATLRLLKHWHHQRAFILHCLLVGLLIGITASIRINAILWYGLLGLLLLGYWLWNLPNLPRLLRQRQQLLAILQQQACTAILITLVSYLTMIVLWPYIFLNPITNLYHAIEIMRNYPWIGSFVFNGTIYPSYAVPMTYIPTWLVIGAPLALTPLTITGIAWAGKHTLKRNAPNARLGIALLALLVPPLVMIALHTTVYNGPRHFLFVIATQVLIAAYGLLQLLSWLASREQFLLLGITIAALLLNYALIILDMNTLHPYEYIYFNELVGGVQGAAGRYELEYWDTCNKPAAQWLAEHYRAYTTQSKATVSVQPLPDLAMPYLPANFSYDSQSPDFYIGVYGDNSWQAFPDYRIIHTEYVDGVPICVVKAKG